jgi:hypothetical protein
MEMKTESTELVRAGAGKKGGQEVLPRVLLTILSELTKNFKKIDGVTRGTCRELVREWHAVGQQVSKVQEHDPKYGEHAVDRLAHELSVRRGRTVRSDELYQAKDVASIYARRDIEKLFDKAEKANVQIYWGHFARGLSLLRKHNDTEFRKKCEAKLIAEGMNVEDFCRYIRDYRSRRGAPRSGVRRRNAIVPKNANAACRQIHIYGEEFANRMDGWDQVLFDFVRQATPEHCTDELLEHLIQTQDDIAELGKNCEAVSTKFETAISRVRRVIDRRAEISGAKAVKRTVHENEDIEVEYDDSDIEVEDVSKHHESNGKSDGKPLGVKEKIARARAKAGK